WRSQKQRTAASDQGDQEIETDGPNPGLLTERNERFDENRIGNEREKASRIARGVEEVGVFGGRMTGTHEPGLQQGAVGGEGEERQSDGDGEKCKQPECFSARRRLAPSAGDMKRECNAGDEHEAQVNEDSALSVRKTGEQMRISVTCEQRDLEEDQRNGPH